MFEIILYLFESCVDNQGFHTDPDQLSDELSKVGFANHEIQQVFQWLAGFAEFEEQSSPIQDLDSNNTRIYSAAEIRKLGHEGIGFITHLEQCGVLSANSRELLLDRTMAIQEPRIDLDQLKWLVFIIIFYLYNEHRDLSLVENIVFDSISVENMH